MPGGGGKPHCPQHEPTSGQASKLLSHASSSCVVSDSSGVVTLVACVKFYEWWSIGGGGPDCLSTSGQASKLLMLLLLFQTIFRGDFVVALVACVRFYEWLWWEPD